MLRTSCVYLKVILSFCSLLNCSVIVVSEKALGKGQSCPKGGDGHPEERCGLQLAPTGDPPGNE